MTTPIVSGTMLRAVANQVSVAALRIPTDAENPATPFVMLELRRKNKNDVGGAERLRLYPTRLEYISSVTGLDMLEVTCFDPAYELIDHLLLIEDLQTFATVRFGFEGGPEMEEPTELVFYRQRPGFGESGAMTTLTFFDRGVFLALPRVAEVVRSASGVTVKDALDKVIDVINGEWDAELTLDTGDLRFLDKRFEYHKPVNESYFRFLWYLRNTQLQMDQDRPPEVFVRNHTLYFRPRRTNVLPIAIYRYFAETPGAQLLRFEPEVNLRPQWERTSGVDPMDGDLEEETAGSRSGVTSPTAQATVMRGVALGTGDEQKSVVTRPAPAPHEPVDLEATPPGSTVLHAVQPEETLQSIGEKYQVSAQEVADLNGITNLQSYTLPPTLQVPVRRATKEPTEKTQKQAFYEFLDAEDHAVTATAQVLGHPALVAGWPLLFENVGKRWSGVWWLSEVRHVISEDGYVCDLQLARDGVPIDVKGYPEKVLDEETIDDTGVLSPKAQEKAKSQALRGTAFGDGSEIRRPGG